MFLFKKIIAPLFMPVPLCLGFLVVGLFLLWCTKKERAAKILISIGTVLFGLLGYGPVANSLLVHLEDRYSPVLINETSGKISDEFDASVKWVVALGGGNTSDPRLPPNGQLSGASLMRLVEAIRVHKMLPGTKLLLAGGPLFGKSADSEVMAKVAQNLGVDQRDIVIISDANDTKDQAQRVKSIIGEERHILVTSASHMPRAAAMFKKLGMRPIPAPTDYAVKQ
ncbi:MAG: ElyC/SanA/YdcF family protein, partial [Candidatus Hodarchaeota archaeon]